jgi:hypothetical protein
MPSQATNSRLHMTINELVEDIKNESKEDTPFDILLDNKSAVDMSVSFKDTKHARHIIRRWHYVISGTGLAMWHR